MAIANIQGPYIVHDNGHIRKSKHYSKAPVPECVLTPYPSKPKKAGYNLVERNIWGETISEEDVAIIAWKTECAKVEQIRALQERKYRKQEEARIKPIRRAYRKQQFKAGLSRLLSIFSKERS